MGKRKIVGWKINIRRIYNPIKEDFSDGHDQGQKVDEFYGVSKWPAGAPFVLRVVKQKLPTKKIWALKRCGQVRPT